MWSSQLPCGGWGWAGCLPELQGPGVGKAAATVSSWQICCSSEGFVPLVDSFFFKCISFWHWLRKSVAPVWKRRVKKYAGSRQIQSRVKRFNSQDWIWVQFTWNSSASGGSDLQGFAVQQYRWLSAGRCAQFHSERYTHTPITSTALREIIIKAEACLFGFQNEHPSPGEKESGAAAAGGRCSPGHPGSERRESPSAPRPAQPGH